MGPETSPNRIRQLRDKRNWTVRDLAQRSGIDFSTVNRFERGTQALDLPRMRRLANALQVHTSELLVDDDVELRADDYGRSIMQEIRDIPHDLQADALRAARELARIARGIAARSRAGNDTTFRPVVETLDQLYLPPIQHPE